MLVGRGRELALLADCLARGRPVVLVGEAGVGQTTALCAAAMTTGRKVFEGGGLSTLAAPSEADNGTIVVAGGLDSESNGIESVPDAEIYRFAPNGNEIGGAIPTWGTYSSMACPTIAPTTPMPGGWHDRRHDRTDASRGA